jgi:hypothetical protein
MFFDGRDAMPRVSISRVSISRISTSRVVNGFLVNGNELETRGIASLLNLNTEKGIFRTFRDESTTVS